VGCKIVLSSHSLLASPAGQLYGPPGRYTYWSGRVGEIETGKGRAGPGQTGTGIWDGRRREDI
jgi:hypothetical protein